MSKSTNPKGAGRKPLPEKRKRTALHINEDAIRGVKYIAFQTETSITEIINTAITQYVEKWQIKNGPIPKK